MSQNIHAFLRNRGLYVGGVLGISSATCKSKFSRHSVHGSARFRLHFLNLNNEVSLKGFMGWSEGR